MTTTVSPKKPKFNVARSNHDIARGVGGCTQCGAAKDQYCVTPRGKQYHPGHIVRLLLLRKA